MKAQYDHRFEIEEYKEIVKETQNREPSEEEIKDLIQDLDIAEEKRLQKLSNFLNKEILEVLK
ncbi:MAG: hypothetical protein AABY22_32655 [Nanoarchaeota archaeon]